MKTHLTKVSLALLSAAFLLGCQDQGSEPVGPEGVGPQFAEGGGPQFAKEKNCEPPGEIHPSCKDGGGGDAETFDVSIRTCVTLDIPPDKPCKVTGSPWAEQELQAKSGNWLHIWDSGGNGTRGKPKYPGAFNTKIFLQPALIASCAGDKNGPSLFDKLNQASSVLRVFDFQVGYDIATNPTGFSFFLFRWEDNDGTFAASTGFGSDGSPPHIDFLGDNSPPIDDITDPTITRLFRITGAKVIAQELDKNKVVRMLECPNEHIIEVTVAPSP